MRMFMPIALVIWLCAAAEQGFIYCAFLNEVKQIREDAVRRDLRTMVGKLVLDASVAAVPGSANHLDSTLQSLIDRLREPIKEIGAEIDVINPRGYAVYSSDLSKVGLHVPEDWFVPPTGQDPKGWTTNIDEQLAFSANISASRGTTAATIVAHSSHANALADGVIALGPLVLISLLFLVLGGLFAGVGVLVACSPLGMMLQIKGRDLEDFAASVRAGAVTATARSTPGMAQVAAVLAIMNEVQDRAREVDQAMDPAPASPDRAA